MFCEEIDFPPLDPLDSDPSYPHSTYISHTSSPAAEEEDEVSPSSLGSNKRRVYGRSPHSKQKNGVKQSLVTNTKYLFGMLSGLLATKQEKLKQHQLQTKQRSRPHLLSPTKSRVSTRSGSLSPVRISPAPISPQSESVTKDEEYLNEFSPSPYCKDPTPRNSISSSSVRLTSSSSAGSLSSLHSDYAALWSSSSSSSSTPVPKSSSCLDLQYLQSFSGASPSSAPSPPPSPSLSFEASLRYSTDLLAASVRSSLRCFNPVSPTKSDSRVLIFGPNSAYRALYLSGSARDFPEKVTSLEDEVENKVNRGAGGMFWAENLDVLCSIASSSFDAILVFNIHTTPRGALPELIMQLERVVRPGGAVAGTGLFQSFEQEDEEPTDDICSSLRAFRFQVESHGFYVHTCMDLSLEGQLLSAQVSTDIRDSSANKAAITGRFLATKTSFESAAKQQVASQKTRPRKTTVDDLVKPKPSNSLVVGGGMKRSTSGPIASLRLAGEDDEENGSGSRTPSLCSTASSVLTLSPSPSIRSLSTLPIPPLACPASLAPACPRIPISVTGTSLGLPNSLHPDRPVFSPENIPSLFTGMNHIDSLTSEEKQRVLDQNICQVYKKDGKRFKNKLTDDHQVIQLCSKMGRWNIRDEYPQLPSHIIETLDTTYELAIAAGLEALKDAGINVLGEKEVNGKVVPVISGLPESMRDETGVIFASSFPCLDSLTQEVTKATESRVRKEMEKEFQSKFGASTRTNTEDEYEYDRKLLFKLLVMANCQLAELIGARGPNTHLNNACSGTASAITLAEDWLRLGRCSRVIVISADNATAPLLLPFLGTGFLALGAATIQKRVEMAAVPFDSRRKGMILGAGAVGLVLEATAAALARDKQPKAQLLASSLSNSAFHATLMDAKTTSFALARFLASVQADYGIDRETLAKDCIYYAHETCTSANGGCAKVEMDALQYAFGTCFRHILMAATKGLTGHPMAVGVEDVMAVASLELGRVPPMANFEKEDPCLKLDPETQLPRMDGRNTRHERKYVLRFAAGFGSHFVYVLYQRWGGHLENQLPLQLRSLRQPLTLLGGSGLISRSTSAF